jgi:hypothetical protein
VLIEPWRDKRSYMYSFFYVFFMFFNPNFNIFGNEIMHKDIKELFFNIEIILDYLNKH